MSKRTRRRISLGTIVMLACTITVLAGFAVLMPSFTGNQDILIDAARLAVAMDDSLAQLSASTSQMLQNLPVPQQTILPPFTSKTVLTSHTSNTAQPVVPTAVPTPTVSPKRSFSLCAAGSIEWNSDVRKALTINHEARYDLLTDHVQQAMQADLSLLTLQNTISASNDLSSVNMPPELLAPIKTMGVNAINLGHISALNFGEAGLNETAQAIQSAGMTAFGARQPSVLSFNGINIALLHYQDAFSATARKQMEQEEREVLLAPIDLARITGDISAVRQAGAQVVIVTLWWGEERQDEPSDEQIMQAQAIADAGADIILGTGSGALQPVKVLSANRGDEKYHPVLCAYSLGNLFSPERESRITLASILLKTNVVYDTSTNTVAFENLTYTPTYAWRGKDEGKTIQRILINDLSNLPDFVDDSQRGVMERCMALVTSLMEDTAIPIAY